jgi:hypothetical protein
MLFNTPEWLDSLDELIYSMDLSEATYNISHDILEAHYLFLEEQFQDNPVWEVYGDLFKITPRELDLTVLKQQGFKVPADSVLIEQGSFMGDGLSFMHLTMLVSTLVNLAASKREGDLHKLLTTRPFGQSVGDDLILLNASPEQCKKFSQLLLDFGLEASKINSIFISGVFAEQYFMQVIDKRDLDKIPKVSLFGMLWFIDSIKTMLLTGRPKVSSDKRNSFIGQANALNKQLAYLHPDDEWKRLRCRVYLWVFNYDEAVKLGKAKPHLPPELGGLNVPIGKCDGPETDLMKMKYLPYFFRMLKLGQEEFLAYYLLLKGIFKSNPKGVPWSNDPDRVIAVAQIAAIVHRDEIDEKLKGLEFYQRMGQLERLRYISKTHGWVSASQIDDELSRRETYLEFWYDPGRKRAFETLSLKNAIERHKQVWDFIRANLEPAEPEYYHRGKELYQTLSEEFRRRLWGFFINREDPAIKWIFEGVNSFYVDFDEVLL